LNPTVSENQTRDAMVESLADYELIDFGARRVIVMFL
jgi:hypothetical protein